MTVAASIFLAALVGGVMFVLIDSWQRRAPALAAPALPREEPRAEPFSRYVPASAWQRPVPPPPEPPAPDPDRPPGLWAGWADRRP